MESDNISSGEKCDLISSLPDPILHHILGVLDTKEAVQTYVLSKRWENLWTFLPSLNFKFYYDNFGRDDDFSVIWDDDVFDKDAASRRFVKFVNTLLLRRNPFDLDVFSLNSFSLSLDYAEQQRNWVCYAMNHNTRVLHLTYSDCEPCYIYNCKSLEELYLYCPFRPVSMVNLPNLRKLTIQYISLNSGNMKNLLSGCTTLEFLRLDSCFFRECITISHECLKHLVIVNCDRDGNNMFINTPNLLSFSYDFELSKTTLNMLTLTFACLVRNVSMTNISSEGLVTFFRCLTNIEFLELHLDCSWHQELSSAILPIFPKLKNVTVDFCISSCFETIIWILKSSPNLTKLTILLQTEECLSHYEEDTSEEDEDEGSPNVPTNTSLMIALSPCKRLEIVEVRYEKVPYRTYNKMAARLVDILTDVTKEFKNLKIHLSRHMKVVNNI